MSKPRNSHSILPPIRACIFDVDGLLVNSEDIYTDIFNNILRSYGKPDVTWTAKSKQQSGGRKVPIHNPNTSARWTDNLT